VERTFRHVAESKNLDFMVRIDPRLDDPLFTDAKRLQQIIKNLLSNAFKFTHQGRVALTVEPAPAGWSPENEDLNSAAEVVAFAVSDTGIGISTDKQQIIFEAFQQADGSTNRKYGGTGLGLAISRELSRLLGGEIRLASTPGRGSTFTLYLPKTYATPRTPRWSRSSLPVPPSGGMGHSHGEDRARSSGNGDSENGGTAVAERESLPAEAETVGLLVNEADDDRGSIHAGDRVLLIVENDLGFARFLLDAAREKGFKGLVTSLGAAALAMTHEYHPTAITLDIYLPDIEGWRVMERLKNDVTTRHIPVCVISTDDARARALESGALAFLGKPLQSRDVLDGLLDHLKDFLGRTGKRVLVLEPDPGRRDLIQSCLESEGVDVATAGDGPGALKLLRERMVDCLVLGPDGSPELAGVAASEEGAGELAYGRLPVVIYDAGGEGEREDIAASLEGKYTVRRAHSPERLFDLTAFFLHKDVARLPEERRLQVLDLHHSDKLLAGKKVLIVDDDMRNIFTLSAVLEDHDMVTVSADNGRDAIKILQSDPEIDIVLMDIMMPEMDGMETMRVIRKIPQLKSLPIVAVTAKAMKGDREKCLEAGAWDYLSKPVDTEQMLAVLRAWLHR
jgi:CheY-like chemotaxis protein